LNIPKLYTCQKSALFFTYPCFWQHLWNQTGISYDHNILWSIHFPIIRSHKRGTCIMYASHIRQNHARLANQSFTFCV